MRATVHLDLIVALAGTTGAHPVPEPLANLPAEQMRFDGAAIVDAATWPGPWWIDAAGTRHVARHDEAWQPLACSWTDALVRDGDAWRLQTLEERQAAGDAAIVEAAHRRIDRLMDRAASPSRAARYARKLDEARRYIAAGRPDRVSVADYPILVAEAAAREITKGKLADLILAAAARQGTLDAVAEEQRVVASLGVSAMTSDAAKRAAANMAVAAVAAAIAGGA